jgi:hypothetical protein
MWNVLSPLLRRALLFALLTASCVLAFSGLLETPRSDLQADGTRMAGSVCRDHVRRAAPGIVHTFRPEALDRVVVLNEKRFQVQTLFTVAPAYGHLHTRAVCVVQYLDGGQWQVVNLDLTPGVRP